MNDAEEIIARLLAGETSDADIERVIAAAKTDPTLRARVASHLEIHGLLGVVLEDEFTRERRLQQTLASIRNAESEAFVGSVQDRLKRRRWNARALAAAAVVAFGFATWSMLTPRTVATITRTESVTWDGMSQVAGTSLRKGSRVQIAAGLLELQIGDRGKMVVEGPADLELASAERSILHRGRVVMRVTPAGHGYRMETPQGSVIDLGTEFGVSVAANGTTETHVLEGEVEAIPNGGQKVLLKRDDALSFADGGGRIPANGGAFYTTLPPQRQQSAGFVHWSLDEGQGAIGNVEERNLPAGSKEIHLRSMDQGALPKWVEGKFGGALAFDGKGSFAESNFRGIGGGKSRTVCFWTKVPKDFSVREGFAMMSWGRFQANRPGEVWQISVNPLAYEGPIGRIRVGTHHGQIVGTTDIRDDEWHHIAIVLYGGSQPNVGTHVLVYLDGKLEPISRRALRDIDTEIETADHGVWLGRNIDYVKSRSAPHPHGAFFRGGIDEPYIFDAALSPDEITELMLRNQLPR